MCIKNTTILVWDWNSKIRHTIAEIPLLTSTMPDYSWNRWDLVAKTWRAVKQVGIWQWYRWCAWLLKEDKKAFHLMQGLGEGTTLIIIGPWVCDGLIQTHITMKQHCVGGSWYAFSMGYGGHLKKNMTNIITVNYQYKSAKIWWYRHIQAKNQ